MPWSSATENCTRGAKSLVPIMNREVRSVPLKLVASVAIAAVLVGAAFAFRPGSGSGSDVATTVAQATTTQSGTTRSAFPAPPKGAVVYARQWGGDAVALGV